MMEYVPANNSYPVDEALRLVDNAHLYIGVFAYRYGFIPAGCDKSVTHQEYERAKERGLECLIFLIDENQQTLPKFIDDGEKKNKLQALKSELLCEKWVRFFTSPELLGYEVFHGLQFSTAKRMKMQPLLTPPAPVISTRGINDETAFLDDAPFTEFISYEGERIRETQVNFIRKDLFYNKEQEPEVQAIIDCTSGLRSWEVALRIQIHKAHGEGEAYSRGVAKVKDFYMSALAREERPTKRSSSISYYDSIFGGVFDIRWDNGQVLVARDGEEHVAFPLAEESTLSFHIEPDGTLCISYLQNGHIIQMYSSDYGRTWE
jgi:hypothetical protein